MLLFERAGICLEEADHGGYTRFLHTGIEFGSARLAGWVWRMAFAVTSFMFNALVMLRGE